MKDKKEGERLLFGKRKPKLPAAEDCEPKLPVLQPDIQKYIPSTPGLLATSISLIGGRKNQQDALDYRVLPGGQFAASVCDGMGGLNGGARASREACSGFFEEYEAAVLRSRGAKGPPDLPQLARRLDRRILGLRDSDGLPLDGGSTLTAVVIENGFFHWLSVGDSRIGLLREGKLHWLNRLHNYRLELDEALRNGDISPEEYQAELPRGPALLSYLGCGELKYIDCRTRQPFLPSDILLLCSDGFCELLPDDAMARTLNSLDDSMTNLPDLTAPFLDRAGRGQDNASAVIIRCRTIQQCK